MKQLDNARMAKKNKINPTKNESSTSPIKDSNVEDKTKKGNAAPPKSDKISRGKKRKIEDTTCLSPEPGPSKKQMLPVMETSPGTYSFFLMFKGENVSITVTLSQSNDHFHILVFTLRFRSTTDQRGI